jgi:phosphoglycolate phosphatase-like HAD superfamily hydrolase
MDIPASIRQAVQSSKAIVFDFDGTLVDSSEIKRRGFDYAFAAYPERMAQIREYCYSFNHTIRSEKFRYVTERILGLQYTPELDKLFHDRYAAFTTDRVANAPEIPGAGAFLASLTSRRTALLSSTPTAILLEILERRGWRDFFSEIQGAPVDKAAWLTGFQRLLGCRPEQIVFFGDTDEDAGSAQAARCTFVRVGKPAEDGDKLAIPDFKCL